VKKDNTTQDALKPYQATMNNGKKLDAKALELNLFLMVIFVLGFGLLLLYFSSVGTRVLFYLW
jgi:hypothetical protein